MTPLARPSTEGTLPPGPARTSLLFLAGAGRSGSTLLERMVAELPGVCPLGEVVHLWERALVEDQRCGCGRRFSACPFWTAVGDRAFGGWDNVDVAEVLRLKRAVDRNRYVPWLALRRLGPGRREALRAYLDHYERIYAAATAVSGATVAIDSSKHVSLAFCLRWSRALDVRVVHMVRDSPGVAYSWSKSVARPEVVGRTDMMPVYGPLHVAATWSWVNVALRRLAGSGVRSLLVRYEDVVEDPRAALRLVASHSDLTLGDGALDFIGDGVLTLTASHTVAGNPMRFTSGRLDVRRDDAWRTRMPPRSRRLVAALTWPVRRRLGYVGTARLR